MNRSDSLAQSDLPPARASTWAWVKRGVGLAFLLLVVVMIVRYARNVDWDEVWASVRALPLTVIAQAAAFAVASHVLYSCFDLFGRRYTGHGVPAAVGHDQRARTQRLLSGANRDETRGDAPLATTSLHIEHQYVRTGFVHAGGFVQRHLADRT